MQTEIILGQQNSWQQLVVKQTMVQYIVRRWL